MGVSSIFFWFVCGANRGGIKYRTSTIDTAKISVGSNRFQSILHVFVSQISGIFLLGVKGKEGVCEGGGGLHGFRKVLPIL